MKIRKKIEIARIPYSVDNTHDFGDEGIIGECIPEKSKILISYDLTKEKQQITFIHEYLHGIFYEYGVDIGDLDEEKLITQLTPGIYELLKQLIK